ncbi:MAG: spermidine synthase [Gemmatimonadaceae bacterium]
MTSALRYSEHGTSSSARRLVYAGLIGSVFMCSWLLFSLEPMSAKMLLPRLGGSPAVWITCLLFFQAALLAGYAYAHVSIRMLGLRRQAVLHAVLVVVSFSFLPVSLAGIEPPPDAHPVAWLLGVLTRTIGVPFVVLASFGPIAQRWLAHADAASSRDPYFLYAASNLGSLLALLAYPFIAEPLLTLGDQATVWSLVYTIVLVTVIGIAGTVGRMKLTGVEAERPTQVTSTVTLSDRARWLVYAAVPSSLLMGVTSFISTDIGSFPLLWVVPLALYLLTFTLVFAKRQWLPHLLMVRAEPQAIVLVALTMYWAISLPGVLYVFLHLALLFLVAMVCHGELARSRPDTRHLTEFYLWLAIGGLVGGVFNALVAPVVFNEILEYPIAIAAAALLRPAVARKSAADFVLPVVFGVALLGATWRPGTPPDLVPTLLMVAFGVALFSFRNHPRRFALALAIMFAIGTVRMTASPSGRRLVAAERSFFGVYRVLDNPALEIRTLEHGRTVHGAQALKAEQRLEPLTYYHRDGPAGDLFSSTLAGRLPRRDVAVVGLGVGSLACYGDANDSWVFYEIDPLVARIAADTTRFTLLRDCPPAPRLVLGDARLKLSDAHASAYDILVIDAFSSDAIPVHLMTREAFREYLRVLRPAGILAVHISNNHVDLEPLVGALAGDLGVTGRIRYDRANAEVTGAPTDHAPSTWVAIAEDSAALGALLSDPAWRQLRTSVSIPAWTDDYSNILAVIRWRD